MKSILVINTPDCCYHCKFNINDDDKQDCYLCHKKFNKDEQMVRQEWCPLKPLPEKRDMFCETSYILLENRGYNSCIDEILGETK